MKPIELVRRDNLRQLCNELGGQARLSEKIDKSPSQISQWLTASKMASGKPRSISSDSAREIEQRLGLDKYWLDNPTDVVYEAVENRVDWPFVSIKQELWLSLSEREKGTVEGYLKKMIEELLAEQRSTSGAKESLRKMAA
jgi:hypothetical protein